MNGLKFMGDRRRECTTHLLGSPRGTHRKRRVGISGSIPLLLLPGSVVRAQEVALDAPAIAPRFDPAEFVVRLEPPPLGNPFTDIELGGGATRIETPTPED